MTPHLNHLIKTVQVRGHILCFYVKLTKIIPNYYKILLFTRALVRPAETAHNEMPHLDLYCFALFFFFVIFNVMQFRKKKRNQF